MHVQEQYSYPDRLRRTMFRQIASVSVLTLAGLSVGLATAAASPAAAAPATHAAMAGGSIVNFAGSAAGVNGNNGDGGPATSASLGFPAGMAVDAAGNIYVADYGNNRVRKVDPGGTITNFAGSPAGTSGNSGDGGPATSATLAAPVAVAVDPAGDVYIADAGNSRVRKVDPGGTISNFAGTDGVFGNGGDGGPATAATFQDISAVAVDAAGNVYIDDFGYSRVRKVDAGGTIANFAGSPTGVRGSSGDGGPATSALLFGPHALAVDSAGDVYIADGVTNRVRKVATSGTITNVAGSAAGTAGNSGDGGPATSATLNEPSAVVVDAAGNIFIGDFANNRVRKVDTGGTITNVAGSAAATAGNSGDGGLATSATLHGPIGLAVDSASNIYVADTDNNRVREVVVQAPAITSATATAFPVGAADSFAVTATGFPVPTVTETGTLPPGVTFSGATRTLSGTPAQEAVGSYPVTFHAANGVGSGADQSFTLTVDQAQMTFPASGQDSVDTTRPFTWSTIAQAQGYILVVGNNQSGSNLVNSGILPPTQSSFAVPALPAGITLHATLLAEVNGRWTSYQAITFTAAPGEATMTFPLNGQAGVDPTRAFTWATIPQAQGYVLAVGTSQYGSNVVNSGVVPATQSSFATPVLPAGRTLYATLLTKVNGTFSRYQAVTFTAGPARGSLITPMNGQLNVATPTPFVWTMIAGAQHYELVVGTTKYGTNLVNSGLLPPTQMTFGIPALPHGKTLYATLLTEVNGTWNFQAVVFTTS